MAFPAFSSSTTDWSARFSQLASQALNPDLQQFYARGMVAGDTPISDIEMVAMDFETTGLHPVRDDIVSIGLVPFSGNRIRCGKASYWVVKPPYSLDEKSVVFHGITHADIRKAPSVTEILPDLLEQLAGKVLVVHFAQIERGFLNAALKRYLGEAISLPMIDTCALETEALKSKQGLIGKLLKRPLGSVRLGDSRARYGLPYYQPHHAQTDALATAELLQAQLQHHFRPDTSVSRLWR